MKQNRILYFCLFFLSLVFVYFYGGKVPYTIFYIMLILPAVSFSYTLVIYLRFKYDQELDKRLVVKGDTVNFIFTISNEDIFLYPYIKVTFCGAETVFANQCRVISFSLVPHSKKSCSFELKCMCRGSYKIGIKTVEIEDFLGIFRLTYKVWEPKVITVYPKIVFLDSFLLKTDFLSESHSVLNTRYEDMNTVLDIRKYAYGDSLKKIHWKLSAKANDLLVKRYQGTSETNSVLVLDLKKSSFSGEQNVILEDKLIESVVAVSHYCLTNWIPVKLVYYQNEKINSIDAKNPLLFNALYEVLARVRFAETIDIKDFLDIYVNDDVNTANIILFTANLNYELYNQIYKSCSSGYDVSLVYVSPEELTGLKSAEEANILANLPEIGVNIYKINIQDDIKKVLECC